MDVAVATAPTVPVETSTAPDQLPYLAEDTTSQSGSDAGAAQSDSGGVLTGLSDIFSSVGTVFSSVYRQANPVPQPKGVTPPPGYYWDGTKGQFIAAPGAVAPQGGLILVLLAVVVIVLIAKK